MRRRRRRGFDLDEVLRISGGVIGAAARAGHDELRIELPQFLAHRGEEQRIVAQLPFGCLRRLFGFAFHSAHRQQTETVGRRSQWPSS
jgi:hypothetical protein